MTNKFVPTFSGTDPKPVMQAQRQTCINELGAGAKQLAEFENELAKLKRSFKEVDETFAKIAENYHTLRSPETQVVKLEEFQYVRMQYRDFGIKVEELRKSIGFLEKSIESIRTKCENMRKNVIFLEERLSQEAKVIPLHANRGQGLERTGT